MTIELFGQTVASELQAGPASKQASKPASKQASKPASKQASKQASSGPVWEKMTAEEGKKTVYGKLRDEVHREHLQAMTDRERILFVRIRDFSDFFSKKISDRERWSLETYSMLPSTRDQAATKPVSCVNVYVTNLLKMLQAQNAKLPSLATEYAADFIDNGWSDRKKQKAKMTDEQKAESNSALDF